MKVSTADKLKQEALERHQLGKSTQEEYHSACDHIDSQLTKQPTNGPWHVGQGNGQGSVFAEEGRMRLEEGGTTLSPICNVIDFDGEREANARLIASAPELMQYVRECRHMLDDLIAKKQGIESLVCGSSTIGNLRAELGGAIKRARGVK